MTFKLMKQASNPAKTVFFTGVFSSNHKISGAGDAQKPASDTLHLLIFFLSKLVRILSAADWQRYSANGALPPSELGVPEMAVSCH